MKRAKAFQYDSNPASWTAETAHSARPRPSCEISGGLQRIVPLMSRKPGDPLVGIAAAITATIVVALLAQGISSLSDMPFLAEVMEAEVETEIEMELPSDMVEQS